MERFVAPIREEAALWRAAGRVPVFWLRDDDAVEPTPALDRLITLTAAYAVPLTLAVIPRRTGEPLAVRLDREDHVTVAVHGWAHRSHRIGAAAGGGAGGEYGPQRPAEVRLEETRGALVKLRRLHGDRVLPVLVPPWNRIERAFVPRLAEAGYAALSAWGPEVAGPVPEVNAQVGIVAYSPGTAATADPVQVAGQIAARMRACRDAGQGAIGVLTHHLMHDADTDGLLRVVFEVTRNAGGAWVSLRDLLAPAAV